MTATRAEVAAAVAELVGTIELAELAVRAGLAPALVADVAAGRLRPSPWVRARLAAALGTQAARLVE